MMSALRTIPTIFAASPGFDAEQRAELHLMVGPIGCCHFSALRNEVKKRLMINIAKMGKGLAHVGPCNNLPNQLSSIALPLLVHLE